MNPIRYSPQSPFNQTDFDRIEQSINHPLPVSYRLFTGEYGGAFVGGFVHGDPELPLLAFFSVDSVLSCLVDHPDLKREGLLPFADCELGNLYVLDRQGEVHYIDYYGGTTKVRKVAGSFNDFVDRIRVTE